LDDVGGAEAERKRKVGAQRRAEAGAEQGQDAAGNAGPMSDKLMASAKAQGRGPGLASALFADLDEGGQDSDWLMKMDVGAARGAGGAGKQT
jgi:hypothetical protein